DLYLHILKGKTMMTISKKNINPSGKPKEDGRTIPCPEESPLLKNKKKHRRKQEKKLQDKLKMLLDEYTQLENETNENNCQAKVKMPFPYPYQVPTVPIPSIPSQDTKGKGAIQETKMTTLVLIISLSSLTVLDSAPKTISMVSNDEETDSWGPEITVSLGPEIFVKENRNQDEMETGKEVDASSLIQRRASSSNKTSEKNIQTCAVWPRQYFLLSMESQGYIYFMKQFQYGQ
ncbi:hypothetical protein A6R68_04874, partial [Neotoma lepida]